MGSSAVKSRIMSKQFHKPTLYFVTPEIDEALEGVIQKAVEGGVTLVQLRDKRASDQEMIAFVKKILPFLKNRGVPLLINDRVGVAYQTQADGVHLGQSDLKIDQARALLGKSALIGLSVETLDQALLAANLPIDYLGASPVFATKTKADCAEPWGLAGLKELCSCTKHLVIAIGGIDTTNVENVLECGAAGVAVVSAIAKASCPKAAAREISKKMSDYVNSRLG